MYQLPAFAIVAGALLGMLRTLPAPLPGRGTFTAFAGTVWALLAFYFATPHSGAWTRFLETFRSLPLT